MTGAIPVRTRLLISYLIDLMQTIEGVVSTP